MKSKIFTSVGPLFIVLMISNLLIAKPQTMNNDTLLVPKASISPEIDGEMDEIWYNVTKTRNLTYVQGTEPDNWLDLFFWFRVMWDDKYFYMFVAAFDDEINTNHNDVWERDGFEIYFDGDNSKNSQVVGYDDNDIQLRWVYGESSGNPGTANAIHAFKDTDFGYNFELAIPTDELPLNFKAEHVFGFDLQHNDNDGNRRQHVGKWWSSSDDNWRNPSLFGTAKLIDREVSNILDINRTAFPPVIDGEMDQLWKFMPEISNNKYCKLGTFTYEDFEDWNDLIYNFRTMWDNENFYLFVNVLDNDRNTSAHNSWENDGFEIYFDGDNSKNSQAQGYDANDVHHRWVYRESSGNPGTPNSEHAWQDTDDGYNFELRIPVDDLPFEFTEDHIFGFELQLNDNDYGTRDKIAKWWSESDDAWLNPSLFGTAKLTDRVKSQNMNVIITSPQQNESFIAGDDITITAEVTILEGTVTKVEFFKNNTRIGEATSSPYSITWQNIIEGEYYLYAIATDNQDHQAKSPSVKITVMANSNLEPAEAPEFSIERGFYETSFDVIVRSQTPGAWIKYTFNGSDPKSSQTALTQQSPATIKIDPESTEGQRGQNPGVVLRACVASSDYSTSEIVTHTYLFYKKVKSLSPDDKKPGLGWPSPTRSEQWIVYGMDPDILNDPRYKDLINDALLDIPTISMSTDLKNLFAADSGIYMNANRRGKDWERPASIELLNPDGTEGFGINGGVRIRGGWSRHGDNPKHAFRLFFRKKYGKGKLDYPLFGNEGADKFDKIDLRTSQNYSWSYKYDPISKYNTMNRDVFSRDLQREMGQPYTRSRYYHLYINGVYWGLFQTQERSEARYAATYFGGDKADYDVVKPDDGEWWDVHEIEATDGNLDAYRELWDSCNSGFSNTNYFKLQGLNPDETRNPAYKVLVDIDNLIDFMLVIFYAGNFDSPTVIWGGNKDPHNFYCIYNRNGNEGFKFFAQDAEHTLRTTPGPGPTTVGLYENRVNIGDLNTNYQMIVWDFKKFHPQWLHFKLSDNKEYRIRFADHVYKHFFNNGCMTPDKVAALFLSRAKEIELAIIAESARWGDTNVYPPRTKDDDWQWAVDDIVDNYLPYRTDIVLDQLKEANLYPNIDPPVFKNDNTDIIERSLKIDSGYKLGIVNPNNQTGSIIYTVGGNDPREIGGNTASSAKDGADEVEITINTTTIVKARIKNGTTWSALHEIILLVPDNTSGLKITEIHYHPLDGDGVNDSEFEFIEFKNIATAPFNLSQAYFEDGIQYTFPFGTILNSNEFIVLASNQQEFNNRYGFLPFGEYSGQLNNGGESIILCNTVRDSLFSVKYSDKAPWPESPDGGGYSLVPKDINPIGDLNDPLNWRASYSIHGSPGRDDLDTTSIENSVSCIPSSFLLFQNYPNPFNPVTHIEYHLPQTTQVKLTIYDVTGYEVRQLVKGTVSAGYHTVIWDGKDTAGMTVTSGIYLYRIEIKASEENQQSYLDIKKMILMR